MTDERVLLGDGMSYRYEGFLLTPEWFIEVFGPDGRHLVAYRCGRYNDAPRPHWIEVREFVRNWLETRDRWTLERLHTED